MKGLPTLPMKLVEKVEYVDMEEFLPAPRSVRLAEQSSAATLQESLVEAFSQLQALQQQKAQHIGTWTRCFTLYIAVLSKAAEMVPSMIAHLHTVLRLQQKASSQLAWLEYDIQFRMELAASADRSWTLGDPWQYVSCLPGSAHFQDPFEATEVEGPPGGKHTKGSAQQSKKWTRAVLNSGSQRRRLEKGSAASTTQHQMGARMGKIAFSSTNVLGAEP